MKLLDMRDLNVMAGRLLWGAVAALLVQGCLIPQDDPVLPDLPQKKNTTPKLVAESARPKMRGFNIRLGAGCDCLTCLERPFEIVVEDPDLGDVVSTRWFVDDDGKFLSVPLNGTGLGSSSEKRGIARPVNQLYTMTNLRVSGTHDVTVVVADRQFPAEGIEMTKELIPLPDGGSVEYLTSTSQYTWQVFTDLTPCNCGC